MYGYFLKSVKHTMKSKILNTGNTPVKKQEKFHHISQNIGPYL